MDGDPTYPAILGIQLRRNKATFCFQMAGAFRQCPFIIVNYILIIDTVTEVHGSFVQPIQAGVVEILVQIEVMSEFVIGRRDAAVLFIDVPVSPRYF